MNNLENYKSYFDKVEAVLSKFPKECSKNYYKNKETLKIEYLNPINSSLKGNYDPKENVIKIYDISSIYHELFHMAFTNRDKLDRELYKKSDMYYQSGIAIKAKNIIIQKGITEGFAEYLSRKCSDIYSKDFDYYFANLLISIYGEEIINFALNNNPLGFYENELFCESFEYTRNLDYLDETLTNIMFISSSKNIINEAINKNETDYVKEWMEFIKSTKDTLHESIINLFKSIIEEYKHCLEPKISKKDFILLLNEFIENPVYEIAFKIDQENTLEKKLRMIIYQFEYNKTK